MFNFHFIIQQCHPIFLNSYCVSIYCTLSGSLNNFASSYFSHMVASLFFVKDVTNFLNGNFCTRMQTDILLQALKQNLRLDTRERTLDKEYVMPIAKN